MTVSKTFSEINKVGNLSPRKMIPGQNALNEVGAWGENLGPQDPLLPAEPSERSFTKP